jgi:hypothetical protein
MKKEFDSSEVNSVYLKVIIVEPILLSCIDESSFSDIRSYLQRVVSTTDVVVKEYLFYLINGSFIKYVGIKKIYLICKNGIELLNVIYILQKEKVVDYNDLAIKLE